MDEAAAREAAKEIPEQAARFGLDEDIPPEFPGHTVPGIGELRRFPATYLTPEVRLLLRLHGLQSTGRALRDDGILHWPARLVQALNLIDREKARRAAHHG